MKMNLFLRAALFVSGLFIMAIGVGLSVKANLGVSPISSIPYVYSLRFPLTLGQTTIIFNIFLILLQILILKKEYEWIQLVQIPVVFLFGGFIDLSMPMLAWITPETYAAQAFYCLGSCVVLGLGVFFEVKAKLTYLPGEGVAMALNKKFGFEFGKAKIGVDSAMVVGGIASCIFFNGNVTGIREGTVAAALLVGLIVRLFARVIPLPKIFLLRENIADQRRTAILECLDDPGRVIVTISRELGSGGHEIGKQVARALGVPFYDQELIQLTADQSGYTSDYIRHSEQQGPHGLLSTLYDQNYAYVDDQMRPFDGLFMVQSKIIRELSDKGPCVIVGRCADFVLKDRPDCFNAFVHTDAGSRQQRVMKTYEVGADEASEMIADSDRKRSNYCRRFTGRQWGYAGNYNLTVDSTFFGIERSVKMIVQAVQQGGKRFPLPKSETLSYP